MNKNNKTFGEIIEDFRYSDSLTATATKLILASLAIGPAIIIGAALPGLLFLARTSKNFKKYPKKQMQRAFQNLKYKKLIEIVREDEKKFRVQLTNKGKIRARDFYFEALSIAKPEKWDGKWRVLIFDIPTKPKIYNQAREALRKKIKDLGFYQMQKSVWVYPYECEDEILFIAELFQVQRHIEILTVEKLLYGKKMRKKFGI